MKILHVISNAPPLFSGAAKQAITIARTLESDGFKNLFISIDDIKTAEFKIGFKRYTKHDLLKYVKIFCYIAIQRPKIIFVHGGLTRLIMLQLCQIFKNHFIFEITNESEVYKIKNSPITKSILKNLSVYVANVTCIPCGLENEWSVSVIPSKLQFDSNVTRKHYVVLGAVCPRKRTVNILTQFIKAKQRSIVQSSSKLLIVGPYLGGYDEYDSSYSQSVRSLVLNRSDILLTGIQDLTQFKLPANSVLIHSAESEGSPNAVLEYLQANMLTIVSNNLIKNFPTILHQFITFVEPENLFECKIVDVGGSSKAIEFLNHRYINNIKLLLKSYD